MTDAETLLLKQFKANLEKNNGDLDSDGIALLTMVSCGSPQLVAALARHMDERVGFLPPPGAYQN